MFSIIIPLYNKAPYIAKAIQSVAAQTYQEFELIVIDDGSTDESLEKLRVLSSELGEKNPEFVAKLKIIEQQNSGVSTTRNQGVAMAKYNYIAFLDADDWWEPNYLSEMKLLIEKYPQAGIYGSSYYKVKNNRQIQANIGVDKEFYDGIINYFEVYRKTFYMPLWTGATIVRKNIFVEENGFKTNLILGEDFDLWVRIALKYPVAFVNKYLAFYNQDVLNEHKAVVKQKIYEPDSIYIFNLDYLYEEEKKNSDLKLLLDLLRVYTFERYRLQNAYIDLVNTEIAKVDFSKQKKWYWVLYHFPVWSIKLFYIIRTILKKISTIK